MESLVSLKAAIKDWERAFMEAHRRKPSKAEVQSQPEIWTLYSTYQKLAHEEATRAAGRTAEPAARAPLESRLGALDQPRALAEPPREKRKLLSPSKMMRTSKPAAQHATGPRATAAAAAAAAMRAGQATRMPSAAATAFTAHAGVTCDDEDMLPPGTPPPAPPPSAAARQLEPRPRDSSAGAQAAAGAPRPPSVGAELGAGLAASARVLPTATAPAAAQLRGGGGLGLARGRASALPARTAAEVEQLLASPCKPCKPAAKADARASACDTARGCVCPEPGQFCRFRWQKAQAPTDAEAARQANIRANDDVLRALGLLPTAEPEAPAADARGAQPPQSAPTATRRPAAKRARASAADAAADAGADGADDEPTAVVARRARRASVVDVDYDEEDEAAHAAAVGARPHVGGGGGKRPATADAAGARAAGAPPAGRSVRGSRAAKEGGAGPSRANANYVKLSLKRSLSTRLKRGGVVQRRAAKDNRRRKSMLKTATDPPAADALARATLGADALLCADPLSAAAGADAAVAALRAASGDAQLVLDSDEDEAEEAAAALASSCEGMAPLEALAAVFGHAAFKPCQLEAIERVLAQQSTLVVLPTGAGKSLCYQLPALLSPGLVLVVSPLLALIDDQLAKLPAQLRGAKLTSAQTREQAAAVLASLRPDAPPSARPKLLFVAPERLTCPAFARAMASVRVAFACVDEAHCVSQWAHHFRPSFLALGRVLRDELGVGCVLALTATATASTAASVLRALRIPAEGLIARPPARPNLSLRAVRVAPSQRLGALVELLLRGELRDARPAIVYVGTRLGCEEAAAALRQAGEKAVAVYHAGVALPTRERVHARFERGALPLLIATCAFGMGVDLASVRAVVHCGLPRSPEHYVQESGRAGRDGRGGTCVALFDEADRCWINSRAHAAAVDGGAVGRLLSRVFERYRRGGALPRPALLRPAEMAAELDMSEETIETVLALLEGCEPAAAEPGRAPPAAGARAAAAAAPTAAEAAEAALLARVYAVRRSDVYGTAELRFDEGGPEELSARAPVVGFLLRDAKATRELSYECDVCAAAAQYNVTLDEVVAQLAELSAQRQLRFTLKGRATHLAVLAEPADLPALARALAAVLRARDLLEASRVDVLYAMMSRAASTPPAAGALARELAAYFAEDTDAPPLAPPSAAAGSSEAGDALSASWRDLQYAHAAVATFVRQHQPTHKLTAVCVARVLHGIGSVGFPAQQWRASPHWGKHVGVPFDRLVQLAAAALLGPAAARAGKAAAAAAAADGAT